MSSDSEFSPANVNVDSGLKALDVPRLVVPSEDSPEATGLSQSCNPVEEDFEIPFDLLCDNPSPYFDARLSTIGALFISYDPEWMKKLFEWMEGAEKRGKLINKNGTVSCRPFRFSSSDDTKF